MGLDRMGPPCRRPIANSIPATSSTGYRPASGFGRIALLLSTLLTVTPSAHAAPVTVGTVPLAGISVGTPNGTATDESRTVLTIPVVLDHPPLNDVHIEAVSNDTSEGTTNGVLTFTPETWNATQDVVITGGGRDGVNEDTPYQVALAVTVASDKYYRCIALPTFAFVNRDYERLFNVSLDAALPEVHEGGGAGAAIVIVTVQLTTADHTADVLVPIELDIMAVAAGAVVVNATSLTFAPGTASLGFAIAAVDNAYDEEDANFTVVVGPLASTDPVFNGGVLSTTLTLTRVDDDDAGVNISLPSAPATDEGDPSNPLAVQVVLNSQPREDVYVTLLLSNTTHAVFGSSSSGSSAVTFTPDTWSAVATVTVTAVADDVDTGNATYTLSAVVGSIDAQYQFVDYRGRVVGRAWNVTAVDDDTAAVTLGPSSREELRENDANSTANFYVTLATEPAADVEVAITTDPEIQVAPTPTLTFTPANWSVLSTMTVIATVDYLADADANASVAFHVSSTDPKYHGFAIPDRYFSAVNTDVVGIDITPPAGGVDESGTTQTISLTLNAIPQGAVTVSVASDDDGEVRVAAGGAFEIIPTAWNETVVVVLQGVDDAVADGAQTAKISVNATSSDANFTTTIVYQVVNRDDGDDALAVSDIAGDADEAGGTATFRVAPRPLGGQSSADVVVEVTTESPRDATVTSAASLTFAGGTAWDASVFEEVTITGLDDAVLDVGAVVIRLNTSSADPAYDGHLRRVSLAASDDDAPMATVSTPNASAIEGAATPAGVTFTLGIEAPGETVVCPISSSDPTQATVHAVLADGTRDNASVLVPAGAWDQRVTIVVTAVDDDTQDGDASVSVVIGACTSSPAGLFNGYDPMDVTLSVEDDETVALYTSPVSGATSEAGGNATFTIRLQSQPSATVTVSVASASTTDVTASVEEVVFSTANWHVLQKVVLEGRDDVVNDGDVDVAIMLTCASADAAYAALGMVNVTVVNRDDGRDGLNANLIGYAYEDGRAAQLVLTLSGKPAREVKLTVTSTDTSEVVLSDAPTGGSTSSSRDYFFNQYTWDIPQTVFLRGVDDYFADGAAHTVITLASSTPYPYDQWTKTYDPLLAITIDDNTPGFVAVTSGTPVYTSEGPGAGGVSSAASAPASAIIEVILTSTPYAAVTITAVSNDTTEVAVPSPRVVIAPGEWNHLHRVDLIGVDDGEDDGARGVLITLSVSSDDPAYAALADKTVDIVNLNNDSTEVVVSSVAGTTDECGGTAYFTVHLGARPNATVTIGPIATNDSTQGTVRVEGVTLYFDATNYSEPQTVVLDGVDDAQDDPMRAFMVHIPNSASDDPAFHNLTAGDLLVYNENDIDSAAVTLSDDTGVVQEVGADGLTTWEATYVLLSEPLAAVTIILASADPAHAAVAPSALVFTNATWATPQTLTVAAVNDHRSGGDVVVPIAAAIDSDDPQYAALSLQGPSVRVHEATTGYAAGVGPTSFTAGQEVRVVVYGSLLAANGSAPWWVFTVANVSEEVQFRVYTHREGVTEAGDCEAYAAAGVAPLYTDLPVSIGAGAGVEANGTVVVDTGAGNHTFADSVATTFVAPSSATPFVICYRHAFTPAAVRPVSPRNGVWTAVRRGDGNATWQAAPPTVYYHLPDASTGQYAIIQLLEIASPPSGHGFVYAASACANGSDPQACGVGDSLKIVPVGAPCTYDITPSSTGDAAAPAANMSASGNESGGTEYIGTAHVSGNGTWVDSGLPALAEGATPGGVGVFGTQYGNPLVDEWTAPGTYAAANIAYPPGAHADAGDRPANVSAGGHAYVYVRLPQDAGRYEVCYSSVLERAALAGVYENDTDATARDRARIRNVPVWRKLPRCAGVDDPASPATQTQNGRPPLLCEEHAATAYEFTAAVEEVGWQMTDLTPESWGTLVLDDSGRGGLDRRGSETQLTAAVYPGVAADPTPPTASANYWSPVGGDVVKLVPAGYFGEGVNGSASLSSSPAYSTSRAHVPRGSPPHMGCWARAQDHPANGSSSGGGWYQDGHARATASFNLTDDPTLPPARRADDAAGVGIAFSPMYVGAAGDEWYVCYRRTCNSVDGARCARHAGFRVLPFHGLRYFAPATRKWLYLGAHYTPAQNTTARAAKFVPGIYRDPPVDVRWYANDTRSGMWGPLIIEKTAPEIGPQPARPTPSLLDARPSNYVRGWEGSANDYVILSEGSALRLVPEGEGCAYEGFGNDTGDAAGGAAPADPPRAVEILNGGGFECASADAADNHTLCVGGASDAPDVHHVAFYHTVPTHVRATGQASATASPSQRYHICFRMGGLNWRMVRAYGAIATDVPYADPKYPTPLVALQRSAGASTAYTSDLYTPSPPPTLTLNLAERRADMEALVIVEDAGTSSGSPPTLSVGPRARCPDGCASGGDVLRVVALDAPCDLNPGNYDVRGVDTHLAVYCATPGAGSRGQSGLLSTPPCSEVGSDVCGGDGCASVLNAAATGDLDAYARVTPDAFDDVAVVPEGAAPPRGGLAATAGVIALPNPPWGWLPEDGVNYKVCYKQPSTTHWATWPVAVAPRPQLQVVPQPRARQLIAGMVQAFALYAVSGLNLTAGVPASSVRLRAKLVAFQAGTGADGMTEVCLRPPAGTEGERFASATSSFSLRGDGHIDFNLTVPHVPAGRRLAYTVLCVQIRTAAHDVDAAGSWYRPHITDFGYDYEVVDNAVRWWVARAGRPTNGGLSTINLVRCIDSDGKACTRENDVDIPLFDTSPGADAAKVVRHGDPCDSTSLHIDPRRENRTAGVTDLAPTDALRTDATLSVLFPTYNDDAAHDYKVCVFTTVVYAGGDATATAKTAVRGWVEASQADARPQQLVVHGTSGRLGLATTRGYIRAWSVDVAIQPATVLLEGVAPADTVLAGASTQYVANPTAPEGTAVSVGRGFHIEGYAGAALPDAYQSGRNEFKLVLVKQPPQRVPEQGVALAATSSSPSTPAWSDVSTWTDLGTDCGAAGAAGAVIPAPACAGTECPHWHAPSDATSIDPVITAPLAAGVYAVCFRLVADDGTAGTWQQLASSATGGAGLYTHPPFLEARVQASGTDVEVFDLRWTYVNDIATSAGTWCADREHVSNRGVPCGVQGFAHDMFSVVERTAVCSTPQRHITATANGTLTSPPAPIWYHLMRVGNETARIAVDRDWGAVNVASLTANSAVVPFVLPPRVREAASQEYKLCLYKAGDAVGNGAFDALEDIVVARRGVVYQLYNRGAAQEGFDPGSWVAPGGSTGEWRLDVTSDLIYDATRYFHEYRGAATRARWGGAVVGRSEASRTPLLRSGTVVEYHVRVVDGAGREMPVDDYVVDVIRCKPVAATDAWDTLACDPAADGEDDGNLLPDQQQTAAPNHFLIANADTRRGICPAKEASAYGWPASGLKQFVVGGTARYLLEYVSACPGGVYGCGVAFAAKRSGGALAVRSPAFWVNIAPGAPNGVAIDGQYTTSAYTGSGYSHTAAGCTQAAGSVVDCYLKVCVSGEPCRVAFQATRDGDAEHAPTGTLSIVYSRADFLDGYTAYGEPAIPTLVWGYFGDSVGAPPLLSRAAWRQGGVLEHVFTPRLREPTQAAVLYLNATYGDGANAAASAWTRYAIRIIRRNPARIVLRDVVPQDVALDLPKRLGVPATVAPRFTNVGEDLAAAPGSYLEALTPYTLTYTPHDDDGVAFAELDGALADWSVDASIQGSAVSTLIAWPARNDDMYATTYETLFPANQTRLTYELTEASKFDMKFRVYVADTACSRFNILEGCVLLFRFTKVTDVYNPDLVAPLTAKIITPVRVPAATLRVSVASTSLLRLGAPIEVQAGTYIIGPDHTFTFVADEFHYSKIFALVGGDDAGGGDADALRGVVDDHGFYLLPDEDVGGRGAENENDDGDACHVAVGPPPAACAGPSMYPMGLLHGGAGAWGARWRLRGSQPCKECLLTFHTTWGAGPQYVGGEARGLARVTFTAEDALLQCGDALAEVVVDEAEGETDPAATRRSQPFNVTVRAVGADAPAGDAVVRHARWWVWTDAAPKLVAADGSTSSSNTWRLLREASHDANATGGDGGGGAVGGVLRGQLGSAGAAGAFTFADLVLEHTAGVGAEGGAVGGVVTLEFRAVGHRYDTAAMARGSSQPTSEVLLGCTSQIHVSVRRSARRRQRRQRRGGRVLQQNAGIDTDASPSRSFVASLSRVPHACTVGLANDHCRAFYMATLAQLRAGIEVDVASPITGDDGRPLAARNFSVVPLPSSLPRAASTATGPVVPLSTTTWHHGIDHNGTTIDRSANSITLASPWPAGGVDGVPEGATARGPGAADGGGLGPSYTFGSVDVMVERVTASGAGSASSDASATGGAGAVGAWATEAVLRIKPAPGAPASPVRGAGFAVCASVAVPPPSPAHHAEAILPDTCVPMYLWVVPQAADVAAAGVALWRAPPAGITVQPGTAGACGADPVSLRVVPYYTLKAADASVGERDDGDALRHVIYTAPLEYTVALAAAAGVGVAGAPDGRRLALAESGVLAAEVVLPNAVAGLAIASAEAAASVGAGAMAMSANTIAHGLGFADLAAAITVYAGGSFEEAPVSSLLIAMAVWEFGTPSGGSLSANATASLTATADVDADVDVEDTAARTPTPDVTFPRADFLPAATPAYRFERLTSDEAFGGFHISPRVTHDVACPTTRFIASHDRGYRVFPTEGVPGEGWAYATQPASVGIPFPLQMIVAARGVGNEGVPARGFHPGNFVKITRVGTRGCNNGGDMTVLALKDGGRGGGDGNAITILPGVVHDSWTPAPYANGVQMYGGVAVAWLSFSAECQHCQLAVELCYSMNPVARCLEGLGAGSERVSDYAGPAFSDRQKFTRPFSVLPGRVDAVQVHAQTLPVAVDVDDAAAGTLQGIGVGDPFEMRVENVLRAARMALRPPATADSSRRWRRTMWVRSEWSPPDPYRSALPTLVYGNGALLTDAARRVAGDAAAMSEGARAHLCGIAGALSDEEMRAAAPSPLLEDLGDPTGGGRVRFAFARPCSDCRVRVEYTLHPPAAGAAALLPPQRGSFYLREYSVSGDLGAVLRYRVGTCGAHWVFAVPPPTAVARRVPFAVTRLWVDPHHQRPPTPHGSDPTTHQVLEIPGSGNGGGGGLSITSPLHRSGDGGNGAMLAAARDGSFVVRGVYPRACYHCAFTVGAARVDLAVVTSAAQLFVRANYPETQVVKWIEESAGATAAEWVYEVYAADARGDRAYTVGGPSMYAYHAAYATPYPGGRAPAELTIPAVPAVRLTGYLPSTTLGGDAEAVEVWTGVLGGIPALAHGSAVVNGIPSPVVEAGGGGGAGVGLATVRVAGPTRALPVRLSLRDPRTGEVQPLNISAGGDDRALAAVSLSVLPTHLAVADMTPPSSQPRETRCSSRVMDINTPPPGQEPEHTCDFATYAIGRWTAPRGSNATRWYLSSWTDAHAAPAATAVCLQDCGALAITFPTGFQDGVATARAVFAPSDTLVDANICRCRVTITAPVGVFQVDAVRQTPAVRFANATAVTATLRYVRRAPTEPTVMVGRWSYASSPTLKVAPQSQQALQGAAGSMEHEADAVARRWVRVRVAAEVVAASGGGTSAPSSSSIAWPAAPQVAVNASATSPRGCFTCRPKTQGDAAATDAGGSCEVDVVAQDGTAVDIVGWFTPGRCALAPGAVVGLPGGAGDDGAAMMSTNAALEVRATAAVRGELVLHEERGVDNGRARPTGVYYTPYPGLLRTTGSGMAAAVVGHGTSLTFRVVDANGGVVRGDYTTMFLLTGRRRGGAGGGVWPVANATAVGGIIAFPLDAAASTRITGACAAANCSEDHDPWVFEVRDLPREDPEVAGGGGVAALPPIPIATPRHERDVSATHDPAFINPTVDTAAGPTYTSPPLYFVRRAERLLAFANIGAACRKHSVYTDAPACLEVPNGGGGGAAEAIRWLNEGWVPLARAFAEVLTAGRDDDGPRSPSIFSSAALVSHTGRAGSNGLGPHPASWGFGLKFDLAVLAVDGAGVPVSESDDGLGSSAEVHFVPMATPCANVDSVRDGAWVLRTCVDPHGLCDTRGDSGSVAALPACAAASSGWQIPTTRFRLHAGRANLSNVVYGPGAAGSYPGITRFELATTDFAAAAPSRPAKQLFEVLMQEGVLLRPDTTFRCEGSGVALRCDGPSAFAAPGAEFDVDLQFLDAMGHRVRSESTAVVQIRGARCASGEPGVFLGSAADGVVQYTTRPRALVRRGTAGFQRLLISGVCREFEVTVACLAAPTNPCSGLGGTLRFGVASPDGDAFIPDPPGAPIVLKDLRLGTATTRNAAAAIAVAADPAAFARAMLFLFARADRYGQRLDVVTAVELDALCVKIEGSFITDGDLVDPTVCTDVDGERTAAPATAEPTRAPAIDVPVPPPPPPTSTPDTAGNDVDGGDAGNVTATLTSSATSPAADPSRRNGAAQQLTPRSWAAYAYFRVHYAVPLDEPTLGRALFRTVSRDLSSDASILRTAAMFRDADAGDLHVVYGVTPSPPDVTRDPNAVSTSAPATPRPGEGDGRYTPNPDLAGRTTASPDVSGLFTDAPWRAAAPGRAAQLTSLLLTAAAEMLLLFLCVV